MQDIGNKNLSAKRFKQLKELLVKLKADKPSSNKSENLKTQDISIIDEALTHTSANLTQNHERLEFLGDAVLRLVASEFIDRHYPSMKVGERSALRAHLVSDKWLTTIGEKIKVEKILIVGKNAIGDRHGAATLKAEATEALIGAIYEYWNDLEPIHTWLTPEWIKESKSFLSNPEQYNYKSALQEYCQGQSMDIPKYKSEEKNFEHGNAHRFFCRVYLMHTLYGEGWGASRRESEQNAAQKAFKKLKEKSVHNESKKY